MLNVAHEPARVGAHEKKYAILKKKATAVDAKRMKAIDDDPAEITDDEFDDENVNSLNQEVRSKSIVLP
jgi:hypothetical protein